MAADTISSEVRDGINFIALPSSLAPPLAPTIENSIKNWLELPVDLHVLDFSAVINLDPALYHVFTNFKNALKTTRSTRPRCMFVRELYLKSDPVEY